MGWSDFFSQIAGIVSQAEKQPAPNQAARKPKLTPWAAWDEPQAEQAPWPWESQGTAAPKPGEPGYAGGYRRRNPNLPQPTATPGPSPSWGYRKPNPNITPPEPSSTPQPSAGRTMGPGHPAYRAHEEKQAELDEQLQLRKNRMDALQISTGALTVAGEELPKLTRMTQEQYDALSPAERGAVDFNTLLTEAVKKDLRLTKQGKYDPTEEQRKTYDDAVKAMFGETRGSDNNIFAPETLAVLKQLDIGSDKLADFDDYLGLKVLITADQVQNINQKLADPTPGTMANPEFIQDLSGETDPAYDRGMLVRDQSQRALAIIQKGQAMLSDFRSTASAARKTDVAGLGGINYVGKQQMLGFGGGAEDLSLQQSYDAMLSLPAAEIRKLAQDTEGEQAQAYLAYVDRRTRNDILYGNGENEPIEGVQRHSAAEMRKLLGLDKE